MLYRPEHRNKDPCNRTRQRKAGVRQNKFIILKFQEEKVFEFTDGETGTECKLMFERTRLGKIRLIYTEDKTTETA